MKAITLQPLTINVGSDIRNPSGYQEKVIPEGEHIRVEESTSWSSSNVWIRWGVYRGKIECGHACRLVERGWIREV